MLNDVDFLRFAAIPGASCMFAHCQKTVYYYHFFLRFDNIKRSKTRDSTCFLLFSRIFCSKIHQKLIKKNG